MKPSFQIAVTALFVVISGPLQAVFMKLDQPGLALPQGFP